MADKLPHEDIAPRRGVLARLLPVEDPPDVHLESLLKTVKATSPKADARLIEHAFHFAAASHEGQFRVSGEPFIEHPLGVAEILAELGMDTTTLVSALLHDVVEDTPAALEDIQAEFGEEVTLIIDGLTKLDRISFSSADQHRAENIRKMILAMAKDIRVLLIKLADRLHNMRTIGHLPRDKQEQKARETLDVYAPLAHRLGIDQVKWQLEDLSFATLHPKRFEEIVRLVEDRQPERDDFVHAVVEDLSAALKNSKVKAEMSGRPKHYWSIYEKMMVRGKEFNEIFDLVGIRVLVDSVRDCYAALGVVHQLWKPIPGRFKDYIAMPKFNMYQSLHTAVVGPGGTSVEIQIRSHAMHRTAEYGIAAHWKYKGAAKGEPTEADLAWLRQMLDWQRNMSDPREFMESLRIDLYADEVFVFTPKGAVLSFPRGSTPIDFAYAIHTEVGHRCIGAKVNGRLVPLDYKMESGDTLEVITSKAADAAPHQDWLHIVHTPRARDKIRQWFTRERREDAIEKGRDVLVRALRKARLPVQKVTASEALAGVASEMKYATLDAMYASLGEGHVAAQSIVQRLVHELEDEEDTEVPSVQPVRMRLPSDHGVVVKGADDILVRLARCCTPVPRDRIMGFITRGRGVSVHRADCPNGRLLTEQGERIVDVEWDTTVPAAFTVAIEVEALDRVKLLRDVTTAISDLGVNIISTQTMTNARTRTASLKFTIEFGDPAHLDYVLAAVKRVDGVYEAHRVVPGRVTRPKTARK